MQIVDDKSRKHSWIIPKSLRKFPTSLSGRLLNFPPSLQLSSNLTAPTSKHHPTSKDPVLFSAISNLARSCDRLLTDLTKALGVIFSANFELEQIMYVALSQEIDLVLVCAAKIP